MFKSKLIILSLIFLWGFFSNSYAAETIAVVVNGKSISYSDIEVVPQVAQSYFERSKGYAPKTEKDFKKVAKIKRELEIKSLVKKIKGVVYSEWVKKFNISISEEEIKKRQEKLEAGIDWGKVANDTEARLKPLVKALKAVYDKGESKDQAFEKYLKGRVDKQSWEMQLIQYKTPEMRKMLEGLLVNTKTKLKDMDWGVQRRLFSENFRHAVHLEIAKEDPEFGQNLKLKKENPAHSKFKERKMRYYFLRKRHGWWLERYKDADIQIKMPEYERVLDILLEKKPKNSVKEK